VDQETIRLAGEIQGLSESDADDDFFKQLEDDEPETGTETERLDRLVYVLAEGDIVRGRAIYDLITMTGALEWWLMALKLRKE